MWNFDGLFRHRTRLTLAFLIVLAFLLSAAGLVDLRFSLDADLALHGRLLNEIFREGRLPAVVLTRDFLVLAGTGIALALGLPQLSPIRACLLTVVVAMAPFAISWYAPLRAQHVPLEFNLVMILVLFVTSVLAGWFAESQSKQNIVDIFGQYVPPQVVASLSEQPDRFNLEGEARELSVFFSDIKNFSAISENLEPRELARLLNTYFTIMTDILYRHGGTIDKYIGDAVMAFWGAPLPEPAHARRALEAGMEMQRALVDLRKDFRARGWPEVQVGIGINTGIMNVGNMGSRFRIAYTVVGDAVNLGARIEHLTRGYDADIIVSETTRAAIPEYLFRELDFVRVRGKFQATRIYEPVCRLDDADADLRAQLALHAQALEHYYARRWDEARALFTHLKAGARFNGGYYEMLLRRLDQFEQTPPGNDWGGVTAFESA